MVHETAGQEFLLTTITCFEHLEFVALVSEAFFGLKKASN